MMVGRVAPLWRYPHNLRCKFEIRAVPAPSSGASTIQNRAQDWVMSPDFDKYAIGGAEPAEDERATAEAAVHGS